jgi:hypothetical protein
MSKRELKLPLTPLTDETFIRQGWEKNMVGDSFDFDENDDVMDVPSDDVYYYTLPVPRHRNDEYTPRLVTNSTDERGLLKDLGIGPGGFFVEIMGTDGLGHCTSEEELEILYRALTGESIEYKN